MRYVDTAILSVCPSICLSACHVPVFYGNALRYCHSLFTTGSPIILSSFISMKYLHYIPTGSPLTGALNTGGVQKFCDFLPISPCIAQTIQDSAIGTMEGK